MNKNTKKHRFIASKKIHPGDLIFYFSLDNIQGKPNAHSVEHVGICVGHDKDLIPQIAHATYGKNTTEVMITPLSALYGYLVFRLSEDNDPKHRIKKKMVDIATTWASQKIPYDFKRKQHMSDFLGRHDTIDSALKASKKAFTGNGDYRALKFAIRGDQPIKKGSPHGFRCDQFVILCLQVAELQLLNQDVDEEYFTPLASPNNPYPWISITNPNRGLIRQLPTQGYQQILSHETPIKDYAKQFRSDFSQRKTKHEKIGKDTAPMIALAKPYFVAELQHFYPSRVPLNAKDCSPSTLIQYFMDDDGGSGFKLIGIVVKPYLAKHFPDHKIIEHDIIEKSIPKKQPVKMDSEGDIFYTQTLQTLLLPSQPQAQSTPFNGLDPTQRITPCLTLFLQHHQQLNDAQLEGIVRHMKCIKRRQLSDAWQNLSSSTQTSLGHRLFHLFNNNTSQEEPSLKRVCARQNH